MPRRMRFKSRAKRKVAKFTHIPTTRSGRKAKARRMATGGCCMMYVLPVLLLVVGAFALAISAIF